MKELLEEYQKVDAFISSFLPFPAFQEPITQLLTDAYLKLVGLLDTEVTLEIGAREASFSIQIQQLYGEKIQSFAFEASPRSHAHYHAGIKKHGVRYINAAISDVTGTIAFHEYLADDEQQSVGFSSIYTRDKAVKGDERKTTVAVKSLTGDAFVQARCGGAGNIALWIDVEGAQKEVLESLSQSFANTLINAAYIEVESVPFWPKQKFLAPDIIKKMYEFDCIPLMRDVNFGSQYNILFVRASRINDVVLQLKQDFLRQCIALSKVIAKA